MKKTIPFQIEVHFVNPCYSNTYNIPFPATYDFAVCFCQNLANFTCSCIDYAYAIESGVKMAKYEF